MRYAGTETLSRTVVEYIGPFSESARDIDRKGYLPLHLAANCRKYAEVVIASLEDFPEADRKKAVKQNLPLHTTITYYHCT